MLEPLNLCAETKLELSQSIDPSLLKTRIMGKEELTYISQNTCVDLLNKAFGFMWSFIIVDTWMEPGVPQIKKENPKWPFTDKNTDMSQVKIDAEGKKYVVLEQGPSAWVRGYIKAPFRDTETGEIIWIEKHSCGAQSITGGQSTQSTNAYKGACSDCLKKCASLFSLALELYRDNTEEEYFQTIRNEYLPDVWDEATITANKKKYDKVMNYVEEYSWSIDDLAWYVADATEGKYSTFRKMPVEYIDNLIKSIEEA